MSRYCPLCHCPSDLLYPLLFLPGRAAAIVAGRKKKGLTVGGGERKLWLAAGQVDTGGWLCSADFFLGETGSGATGRS